MSKALKRRPNETLVERQLRAQHAMHGLLYDIYEDIGGFSQMANWARENQTDFYKLFINSTPSLMPTQGLQGEVEIKVSSKLQPTTLDGEYEEVRQDVRQEVRQDVRQEDLSTDDEDRG